jgi:hypothetical protein
MVDDLALCPADEVELQPVAAEELGEQRVSRVVAVDFQGLGVQIGPLLPTVLQQGLCLPGLSEFLIAFLAVPAGLAK